MKSTTQESNVGGRIRDQRKKLGLSLRACAVRAGVAPSFLSKVESGRAAPTIMTLQKIVEALGLDLGVFFTQPDHDPESVRIVFPTAQMNMASDVDRMWRFAFPGRRDIKVAMAYEEYLPQTRRIEWERHRGDVYGIVIQGELTLELEAGQIHKARKGDAFVIPAGMEHMTRNDGPRKLVLVSAKIRA